ncbi:MAG: helix-turn-helix transcriptional regulator [Gaiellaceae bacterium]
MSRAELLARNDELAAIERLLTSTAKRSSMLMLEGEAGIGKTSLWQNGLRRASDLGYTVLSCRPSPNETPLAFSALGDLLGELTREFLPQLPPPQRRALEVSLLLRESDGAAPDQRAISLAALNLLRAASKRAPLLIAVDDVQWLDASSARVLAFVFRRIEHDRCRVLLARRIELDGLSTLPVDIESATRTVGALERQTVGPLDISALQRLVRKRTGTRLPHQVLVSVCTASGGNPFFALELARAQSERRTINPGDPLQVPDSLGTLIRQRLQKLSQATQETLLIASALFEPTVELVAKAGGGDLNEAIEAGVIEISDDRVRFAHPLHASVLYSEATPERRRELHSRLIAVAPSAEERARHLALGSDRPSTEAATKLDSAASQAAARGAFEAAAEFCEHAARLTPPGQIAEIRRRHIQSAENFYVAGDLERAQALAEAILAESSDGSWRADVLVLLSDLVENLREGADLCRRAVEAARGDDRRLALANIRLGAACARLGDQPAQLDAQRAALEHAELSGDSGLIVEALQGVVNATVLGGGEIDEAAMERAIAIESELGGLPVRHSPRFWLGDQLHLNDELDRARPLLDAALERSIEEGEVTDRLHVVLPLIDLETQTGNWDRCESLIDDALEQALDVGQEYTERFLRAFQLQLRVLRGEVGRVREAVAALLAQAETSSDRPQAAHLLSLAGLFELSVGDADAAWRRLEPAIRLQSALGRSWCCGSAMSYANIVPNTIEALVTLGQVQAAEHLLTALEARTESTKLPSRTVVTARSRALVAAAKGDLGTASEALSVALEAHKSLSQPFELGRTMLVLGTVERRAKRKRNAREALDRAAAIFDRLGARLWTEKTRVELKRVVGRGGGGLELTATERQVAELVAAGQSNKEVAAALFVSARTVEANLFKIFRKLGIESRSELAGRFGGEEQKVPEDS